MNTATRHLVVLLLFTTTLWMRPGASAAPHENETPCLVVDAVRGDPLKLSCRGVNGCHLHPARWANITGGRSQEIKSGISATGVLTISSATSDVGGQKYRCTCGAESMCYDIHVPPLVTIEQSSADVVVGGEVEVACYAVDGYPTPTEILLVHPRWTKTVQNGQLYSLKNLGLDDSGRLECILPNVSGQPSAVGQLNVFNKPQLVNTTDAVVSFDRQTEGRLATLSCSVLKNQCRTVVMFSKEGSPVNLDNSRYTQYDRVSHDSLVSFLIIGGVGPEDIGHYECLLYANYSTLIPVATQGLEVLSLSPPPQPTTPSTGGSTPLECTNGDNQVVVGLAVALALVVVLSLIIIAVLALCLFHNKRSTTTHASKASSTTTL